DEICGAYIADTGDQQQATEDMREIVVGEGQHLLPPSALLVQGRSCHTVLRLPRTVSLYRLLVEDAGLDRALRHFGIGTEGTTTAEAGGFVEAQSLVLIHAGLDTQQWHARGARLRLQPAQDGLGHAAAAHRGLRIHSLQFRIAGVETDAAAGYGC